jgi:hypothetical protein
MITMFLVFLFDFLLRANFLLFLSLCTAIALTARSVAYSLVSFWMRVTFRGAGDSFMNLRINRILLFERLRLK